MRLLIANKNYSSWSMRPWVLMRQLAIPFVEEKLSFNQPDFKAKVLAVSPVGKVPVLIDGPEVIWDSLAIVEALAERFPDRGVWPEAGEARARARSNVAEMHSGFAAMRQALPMNVEYLAPHPPLLATAARRDVARIAALFVDARARFGAGGPYLFGRFSAADAYFAPVAVRFRSYRIALPADAAAYVETLLATPAVAEWCDAARAEADFVPEDEPYRDGR